MSHLEPRVERLEHQMTEVRIALARIEGKVDNCVTKAQLTTYALAGLLAVLGGGWWIVQQYLSPILKSIGAGS